jgi:hypothetical protein
MQDMFQAGKPGGMLQKHSDTCWITLNTNDDASV